jgi:hypothetical protein
MIQIHFQLLSVHPAIAIAIVLFTLVMGLTEAR